MLRRRRPLHEPRRILESDAKTYAPAVAAGVAVGLLLLAVLLVVERRGGGPSVPGARTGNTLMLEPVERTETVPLGAFGACVEERLLRIRPDGAETDAEMRAAQDACLELLGPVPTTVAG